MSGRDAWRVIASLALLVLALGGASPALAQEPAPADRPAAAEPEPESESEPEPDTETGTVRETEGVPETEPETEPLPVSEPDVPFEYVPPPPVAQAADDERPPVARPISRRGQRIAERAERLEARRLAAEAEAAASSGPPAIDGLASPHADPLAGRRYPIRAASRPLTLPEGTARLDHAIVARGSARGFLLAAPNRLALGVTNDVEIGLAWPITRDPTLIGTVRAFGSDVLDVGARVAVTVPVITTGDTVLRMSIPIVLRGWGWLRVQTGVDVDLLFTAQVSPLVEIPLQVMAQVSRRFYLGVEGTAGLLDGVFWTGQVGAFVGQTLAATSTHPILDARASFAYLIDERDIMFTLGFSFFPRIW